LVGLTCGATYGADGAPPAALALGPNDLAYNDTKRLLLLPATNLLANDIPKTDFILFKLMVENTIKLKSNVIFILK
jgi:hypothetical protein